MRITIQANGKSAGETNVDSDDPRMLGHAVRAGQQRLQDVAQKEGTYVLTLVITKDDVERTERAQAAALAAAASPAESEQKSEQKTTEHLKQPKGK